ncbi:uncharacterized protein LOC134558620 [Prinia subflava]|uniref:uncharacterized protein LOC134558620 n=1 Tax=Prinia subflava TaxID=208062 RepID=UPI002FE02A06
MTGEVLFFRPGPKMLSLPTILLLTSLLAMNQAWIVPQPRTNVWALLAKSLGQDHICLNEASASDPMSTCLVGIPFQKHELPERLLYYAHRISKVAPRGNAFITWRNFFFHLQNLKEEPQELELLGSAKAPYCIYFSNSANALDPKTKHVVQSNALYRPRSWCRGITQGILPPQIYSHPKKLPKGVFMICGDRAWAGIPSHLSGGPCTLGKVGLFTPNKTQIMGWKEKQQKQSGAHGLAVSKRDLKTLDPDCNSEIIHWSKAKGVAITIFAPWVSIAKAMGELGHLECWVAKQANLTSSTLFNLLQDEDITRQATLQNRAAIDYLLLLHGHSCEEFEGLCCFNLSTRAESTRRLIEQMRGMIGDIKKETDDWMSNIFKGWGLSGWVGSILRTCLLILFIILIISIAFGLIRRMLFKLVSNSTSLPTPAAARVTMATAPDEDLEEFEEEFDEEDNGENLPHDQWPTQQEWFAECYPDSEYLPDPPQFRSF